MLLVRCFSDLINPLRFICSSSSIASRWTPAPFSPFPPLKLGSIDAGGGGGPESERGWRLRGPAGCRGTGRCGRRRYRRRAGTTPPAAAAPISTHECRALCHGGGPSEGIDGAATRVHSLPTRPGSNDAIPQDQTCQQDYIDLQSSWRDRERRRSRPVLCGPPQQQQQQQQQRTLPLHILSGQMSSQPWSA